MFDIVGSSLMNVALTLIPASIYQMLRGMIIIVTSAFSVIFLKRKLYRHHWSAVGVIFTGVLLVGVSAVLNTGSNPNEVIHPFGIVLLLIS